MPNRYFEIKYKREAPGVKARWIRIGSATETDSEHGPVILGTIEATPLNWDGTFMIVPSVRKLTAAQAAAEANEEAEPEGEKQKGEE